MTKNNLTTTDTLGISVTSDEYRIINNLRKLAQEIVHGTLEVSFRVHKGKLKTGDAAKIMVRV